MTNRAIISFISISLAATALTGCSNFNGEEVRLEHAVNYPGHLAEKTRDVLA